MIKKCIVCDRDVLPGLIDYCCPGCSAVHTIITKLKLEGAEKDQRIAMLLEGVFPGGEDVPDSSQKIDNSESISLVIKGMVCPACSWLIHNRLKKSNGIGDINVNFISELCELKFDPMEIGLDDIIQIIQSLGYQVHKDLESSDHPDYLPFGLGWFLALNCMMISFVVYSAEHWDIPYKIKLLCSSLLVLFGTLVPLYAARKTFYLGIRQLLSGIFRMESLVVLSTSAAWIYSVLSLFLGNFERLYFDVVTLLLMLIETGNLITGSFYRKLYQRVNSLSWMLPKKVRCNENQFFPLEEIYPGFEFKVNQNELVPTDGILLGSAEFDCSLISGESSGILMQEGQYVGAGSKLLSSSAVLIIPPSGKSNLLKKIVESTIEAFNTKKNQITLGDRISQFFVPTVISISIFVLGWFILNDNLDEGFYRLLSILIVACPCAFGIAEPLVLTSAIDKMRRIGIQIFNGSILTLKPNTIIFDKTGTLTKGKLQVHKMKWLVKEDPALLDILSSLENGIEHPVAKACVGLGNLKFISNRKISNNQISGIYENSFYKVGNIECYPNVKIPSDFSKSTVVLFGNEEKCFLIIGLIDCIRDESEFLISSLNKQKIKTLIYSGDRQEVVTLIANKIGIYDAKGSMKSEDKQKEIIELQRKGETVMMVGDGVNDAQALASADIGLAVCSGQIPAKMSSDGVLLESNIGIVNKFPIIQSIVLRKIYLNYGWSFLYNITGVVLAVSGLLSPKYCAVGMVFSNFVVIYNSIYWKKNYIH